MGFRPYVVFHYRLSNGPSASLKYGSLAAEQSTESDGMSWLLYSRISRGGQLTVTTS